MGRYRLNVDYTSATQGSDNGQVVYTPNVAVSGTVTTSGAITSPLGTNTIAASVSITPATASQWAAQTSTYALDNNGTAVIPKFAAIAASSNGNNTLISAVTSKKIRVLAFSLMASAAVNAKFQSGAGGTDLTGLKYFAAAGGGICQPFNPAGWFETASATLLNLSLSGGVAVGGEIVYIEV